MVNASKRGRKPADKAASLGLQYIAFLVNRTATTFWDYSKPRMQELGLTVPKWRVLYTLALHGELRVGELAKRTDVGGATLTRILADMTSSRLIHRRIDPTDTRAFTLSLAPRGVEVFKEALPLARRVERVAIEGLSVKEIDVLQRALIRMYDNLKGGSGERE